MAVLVTSVIFFCYDILMNRQARESEIIMNTKRLFVRYVSHEIRTPLNTVYLGLSVLKKEITTLLESAGVSSSIISTLTSWIELIEEVEDSSNTAVIVLNDLINYDKILMGTTSVELEEMDVWKCVEDTVRPFLIQAKQKNITLFVDLELNRSCIEKSSVQQRELSGLVAICDSVKISQVLRNLISNALKFTPEKGTVTVTGNCFLKC